MNSSTGSSAGASSKSPVVRSVTGSDLLIPPLAAADDAATAGQPTEHDQAQAPSPLTSIASMYQQALHQSQIGGGVCNPSAATTSSIDDVPSYDVAECHA